MGVAAKSVFLRGPKIRSGSQAHTVPVVVLVCRHLTRQGSGRKIRAAARSVQLPNGEGVRVEWYNWVAPYLYVILMVATSVVLIVRGQYLLGFLLLTTSLVQGVGWEYLYRSAETPGFTENLSMQYRLVSGAVDLSVITHYVVILVVVWRFVPLKLNK